MQLVKYLTVLFITPEDQQHQYNYYYYGNDDQENAPCRARRKCSRTTDPQNKKTDKRKEQSWPF